MGRTLGAQHLSGLELAFAELDEGLASGLKALELDLSLSQRRQLLDYLALLARWNKAYNLTAIDQPREMLARHLLDSLSILPWLTGNRIVDAGTGAGLPGVPLAIACPERHFTLVDGNGKKIRFLRQVRRELKLGNIEPVHARLEDLPPEDAPDSITARALAPLERLVAWHRPWLERGTRLFAMKGRLSEEECAEVPPEFQLERHDLDVAGTDQRTLAIIQLVNE